MSLPEPWVDKIFTKLALTYGEAFMRAYGGLDIADVKANWAHELSGFQQHPDAIAHGLQHLPPEKPPTVLQFRDLCRRAPPQLAKALPRPAPNPDLAQKVRGMFARRNGSDARAWAFNLEARDARGEPLTQYQRQCYREALRMHLPDVTGDV